MNLVALVATGFALLLCGPAQAVPADGSVVGPSRRVMAELCPAVLQGKIDMNDAAALAAFGVTPLADAAEQDLRVNRPGIEVAKADFDDGNVVVSVLPTRCSVLLFGANRLAAQDAAVTAIRARGATVTAEKTLNDTHFTKLRFQNFSVLVQRNNGSSSVSLSMTPGEN